MGTKIYDIIFILDLFSDDNRLKKNFLMLHINNIRLEKYVNWHKTYALAIKLKLLKENKGYTSPTLVGENFYSMEIGNHELSIEQKKLIFYKCILGNKLFSKINLFLDFFTLNEKEDFELFKTETKSQTINLTLDDKLILNELDIIKMGEQKFLINETYSEKIAQKKFFNSNEMTESELEEILDEQKEIGDKAESLTLKFERNEFRNKNWIYQANNVKLIAKKNVKAGYDVESFLTKNSKLDSFRYGDKHIEVKGRKWKEFSFIISANELKVGSLISKKKNEQYLIYFWNNLGSKNPPTIPTKIIPFKNLKITPCKNCLKYLVCLE